MSQGSVELKLWRYATSARDEPYLVREIRKSGASLSAVAKLELAMSRLENGQSRAGEHSRVRGDIWELRVNYEKHWYRLLFARDGDLYIALFFGAKKTNKLDSSWIETAESRLRDYRRSR